MSYRNDHDAALARIDALEAELGKNSDAKDRFASLEQQLATARSERDRMRAALAKQEGGRGSLMIPAMLGGAALLVVGGFALAIHSATRHIDNAPAAPDHLVEVAKLDAHTAELMACVRELDSAVARHATLTGSCLATIKQQAGDLTLGPDIHAVLNDWYGAETRTDVEARDALVSRIHAYVIPSYTR